MDAPILGYDMPASYRVFLRERMVDYGYDVYITSREARQTLLWLFDGRAWSAEALQEGASSDSGPSLILPKAMLQQLALEASDLLPPDRAMAQHLADSIQTRDRLLTMIEKRGIR